MTSFIVDLEGQDLQSLFKIGDDAPSSIRTQVVVVEVQGRQLAFPSVWVDEVLYFSRQQVLPLPFYQKPVIGLVLNQGRLLLLVDLPSDTPAPEKFVGNQDYIRALQLSPQMGDLAGVAIKIDRIVGTINNADLELQSTLQLFDPDQLSLQAFQPYRWA